MKLNNSTTPINWLPVKMKLLLKFMIMNLAVVISPHHA